MFLLPFIGSSICDSLVLYFYYTNSTDDEINNSEGAGKLTTKTLFILAIIRLTLLMGPLSYHTATGRRLKWSSAYYFLYISSVLFILGHMLSILLLNPQSLNAFSSMARPYMNFNSNENGENNTHGDAYYYESLNRHLLRLTYIHKVWAMLTFSLWSTALHVVALWHVRSTGPDSVVMDQGRRDARKIKRMMAYASINKYARHLKMNQNNKFLRGEGLVRSMSETGKYGIMEYNQYLLKRESGEETLESLEKDDIMAFSDQDDEGSGLLLPYEEGYSIENRHGLEHDEEGLQGSEKKRKKRKSRMNNLLDFDGDDAFFSDLQNQMRSARKLWSEKLNELQKQMLQNSSYARNMPSPNNFFLNFQLSPFRVLLQLFAYEEVLSNGRLDACFEMDGGEQLTFYVPQLLSFLLYGAYLNAPELELWILEKCRQNIYFAHRCFWFLRAWCLGAGKHHSLQESGSSPQFCEQSKHDTNAEFSTASVSPSNNLSCKRLYGSETNLYKHPSTFSSSSAYFDQNDTYDNTKKFSEDDLHLLSSKKDRGSKFPIEEHRLIEALLFRVIDCGEISARDLQFGKINETLESGKRLDLEETVECYPIEENPHTAVGTFLASSTQKGFIPVDPTNGFPSVRHLDSYTAKQKYGFMPLNEGASFWHSEKYFFGTPRFLDALSAIADDLMLVPRERRTNELRKRLKTLEVELLPSNVVYLPMKNAHHRVWRIVPDESIALSTKERVPCIVCLEVVDYDIPDNTDNSGDSNTRNNDSSGRTTKKELDILTKWYKSERRPQRHNTLLEKVTLYTQRSFRKWRNDIEYKSTTAEHDLSIHDNQDLLLEEDTKDTDTNLNGTKLPLQTPVDEPLKDIQSSSFIPSMSNLFPHLANAIPQRLSSFARPGTSSYGSSVGSSPANSRPSSPTKTMGQWSSPPQSNSMRKRAASRTSAIIDPGNDFVAYDFPLLGSASHYQRPSRRMKRDKDDSSRVRLKSSTHHSDFDQNNIITGESDEVSLISTTTQMNNSKTEVVKSNKQGRPPPVVFKEDWSSKETRLRSRSAYGNHTGWRLLPVLIKSNDDLRQEQLASQVIKRMSVILAIGKVPVWICPYEIIALFDRGGIIEAIPDTISIDSLKRNYPDFSSLHNFFIDHFGGPGTEKYDGARANFVESMAAYSIVCYLLQIKDRHNGNILLDSKGHIIHIDFGFFFLSSPGKNSGFESAPFKLTSDFVEIMGGPFSRTFARFRDLCCRTFLELRKHCYEITLLVEMLTEGNEDLTCFRGRPDDAVRELRERFRLDLSDRACLEYVNSLVDESLENWRTTWYDRYQRYCVGVL